MQAHPGVLSALSAAVLFGASTPLAKRLVGDVDPVMLAGLLYAGSGLGLACALLARFLTKRSSASEFTLPRGRDLLWLGGAILFGGVLGPVLLMLGLTSTAASVSALLLNLEAVFTALLAWFVFRENFDRRIALGMGLIVLAGVVLAWTPGSLALSSGALFVAGACLCWAIDNNFTRKVAANDAMTIAAAKGLIAGVVNIGIALAAGATLPSLSLSMAAALVGLAGYGVSLMLFIVALRELGTARTGAYFSVAPFFGAAVAIAVLHEPLTLALLAAGALMACGVWLHVSERHEHRHTHERLKHAHSHVHDEHHRHVHGFVWEGEEPHAHPHTHQPMRHAHPHFPDIHHQHRH
jgi:drug/metabolite transporter (DMT)-like permease